MTSSLPPHLLRPRGSSPGDARRGGNRSTVTGPEHVREPQRIRVSAGTPGAYDPELAAGERPRNLAELDAAAQPADPAPWPAGSWLPIGTSGRRVHWTGQAWKGGESPGYETVDRSETEQSTGGEPGDDQA